MECEIKLALDSASVNQIKKIPLLRAQDGARPEQREHVDRYFDSADFTLWQHGFALRVRSEGTRHVQTLKGGGTVVAGLHRRVELEEEVSAEEPDRAVFARQLREALPALAKQLGKHDLALEPVFVNKVKRTAWVLALADDLKVECALDTGELQRGERTLPVRELELEMQEGDPARLYDLARQVHEAVPVRIENVSKAERGYAMAGAVAPRAVKATPVTLRRKASMGEALAGILRNCLEQMQANEQGVLAGEVESLHQMRVGLRRLRAAMAMVKDLVQLPAPLADDVEWLAGELGDARNWDVFIESLLPGLPVPDEHKPALARVEVAAREEAERHRARVRSAVGSPRYTSLMLGLGAWIAGQGWQQAGQPAPELAQKVGKTAPGLVRHAAARVRKRARGIDLQHPETLHKVRIAAKKERYAREFFAALSHGKKEVRRHDMLTGMQDELGLLNDSVVARELVGQLRDRVPQELALLGFIEGVLAARAFEALPRAGKHVRRKLRARAAF
ncbi:CHAD domain-containing protein [Massilia norwichensis]|uniref:CYTH and CHAD domain-containing protein n=1 Tax=Massilia norwichensis TaxID=1442366 RepID=A0ABT2A1J7_9BURK|nr:CYTH and CHAD domain-containing protein [Massilia norwichensis]MCS0588063.1 CYTH and CHAD domain-containing protein [Massilia norwichensis]